MQLQGGAKPATMDRSRMMQVAQLKALVDALPDEVSGAFGPDDSFAALRVAWLLARAGGCAARKIDGEPAYQHGDLRPPRLIC